MPPHRSGPNHRFRPGWWAAVVVQPAGVLHGAVSAAPRSARRTTRNDQPSHHPTCLLISKEEDGRLSRTGHAPAQERAEPSIGAGPVGCSSSSARWCAARCSPHRSGPNHRFRPGWWAAVVVQPAGVLHGAPRTGAGRTIDWGRAGGLWWWFSPLVCCTMRSRRHPVLYDERQETTSPATTPRAFSSVRRRTGDSAELAMPPHRSGPNHRFRPGWWAAVVVQPAGVLHDAFSAAPRSARRTTRNDQPGHDLKEPSRQ